MGVSWSCADHSSSILPRIGAGAYRVGCADLMLKESKEGDSGVFIRFYYPVDHNQKVGSSEDGTHPLWLQRREYLDGLAGYMKQSTRRLQFISSWLVGEKRSPALWHLPLAGCPSSLSSSSSCPSISQPPKKLVNSRSFSMSNQNFPVVVFSHGLAGCRHFYSTFCSSLAAYGYVVAAIEHRDYSACWTYKLIPDILSGRPKERPITMKLLDSTDKEFKIRSQQLGKRVTECVKTLHLLEELHMGTLDRQNIMEGIDFDWTQFKGRLNMSRTAVIGHSFGGATAMAATAFSTDFQASVVLDGWMFPLDADHYNRAGQPTMFLNAGKWQWKENVRNMKKFGDEAERLMFTYTDGVHQSFTDFPFLVSPFIGKRIGLQGESGAEEIMESVVEMTVSFLRRVHEGETAGTVVSNLAENKFSMLMMEGTNISLESS